jgi:hypothetical protein
MGMCSGKEGKLLAVVSNLYALPHSITSQSFMHLIQLKNFSSLVVRGGETSLFLIPFISLILPFSSMVKFDPDSPLSEFNLFKRFDQCLDLR